MRDNILLTNLDCISKVANQSSAHVQRLFLKYEWNEVPVSIWPFFDCQANQYFQ